MKALVGYTGFVGSNLCAAGDFDAVFNSKNIQEAYGLKPDLLVYAGLRAEKYLANNAPEKDMQLICEAEENIERINPKKLVLISTIDVFKVPKGVDENTLIDTENLHPYGYNRYQLELWVREKYPDALIVRLPGLFGLNIKKNFIYDCINIIPFMLKEEKFKELAARKPEISGYYELQDNGFYKTNVTDKDRPILKELFKKLGFSALNFTDSRSSYQFYDLSRLWTDIQIALSHELRLWHPATEPVTVSEVYCYLYGHEYINELSGIPADYDYRTIYAEAFGGMDGYIERKDEVLKKISDFVEHYQK